MLNHQQIQSKIAKLDKLVFVIQGKMLVLAFKSNPHDQKSPFLLGRAVQYFERLEHLLRQPDTIETARAIRELLNDIRTQIKDYDVTCEKTYEIIDSFNQDQLEQFEEQVDLYLVAINRCSKYGLFTPDSSTGNA